MLNRLLKMIRRYDMVSAGDTVICAVSGGADSMALLWGLYLLREKLDIQLQAAHFNHHLRQEESDRDEAFVREFCHRFDIPLHVGSKRVEAGEKGLEAAARDARYAYFAGLPGKIATAHTADDNAETVLMHLVRGTGLKGLGAIAPVNGRTIRPMLTVTRAQVLAFLEEYHIGHVEDSSNAGDAFLRNRIRHHVMPLLTEENPKFSENTSAMAMRLRQDEEYFSELAARQPWNIQALRQMHPAQRSRVLEHILKESGVKEPEAEHIALAEALVFSENPSARADFPGGVTVCRCYDELQVWTEEDPLQTVVLELGETLLPQLGMKVICADAEEMINTPDTFTVHPVSRVVLRCRQPGDEIRLPGGTKSLKKLFTDRKIPASQRLRIPVVSDEAGVLGVYGIGVHGARAAAALPALQIRFESMEERNMGD